MPAKFRKAEGGTGATKNDASAVVEIVVKLRGKAGRGNIVRKVLVAAGKVSDVAKAIEDALFA